MVSVVRKLIPAELQHAYAACAQANGGGVGGEVIVIDDAKPCYRELARRLLRLAPVGAAPDDDDRGNAGSTKQRKPCRNCGSAEHCTSRCPLPRDYDPKDYQLDSRGTAPCGC